MGLDMYLTRTQTFWNNEDIRKKLEESKKPLKLYDGEQISSIIVDVKYWRKSNAIHNWFVENVQDGTDDCGEYPVSSEKLDELLYTIQQVLEDHDKAEELLPTAGGFFFGSTDYDEYYFQDLQDTLNDPEKYTEKDSDGEYKIRTYFIYSSSW